MSASRLSYRAIAMIAAFSCFSCAHSARKSDPAASATAEASPKAAPTADAPAAGEQADVAPLPPPVRQGTIPLSSEVGAHLQVVRPGPCWTMVARESLDPSHLAGFQCPEHMALVTLMAGLSDDEDPRKMLEALAADAKESSATVEPVVAVDGTLFMETRQNSLYIVFAAKVLSEKPRTVGMFAGAWKDKFHKENLADFTTLTTSAKLVFEK